MKKIFLYTILLMLAGFFITSCEKEKITGTATENMAGEWYVTADAVDASGALVYEDLFGVGHFHLDTYNTSANTPDSMYVTDGGNFWDFKIKVGIDQDGLSFVSATNAPNESYPSGVTITDGKILKGAATTPSGMPADSIVFIVSFDDDPYPAAYGYDSYRIAGFRYTGFVADE